MVALKQVFRFHGHRFEHKGFLSSPLTSDTGLRNLNIFLRQYCHLDESLATMPDSATGKGSPTCFLSISLALSYASSESRSRKLSTTSLASPYTSSKKMKSFRGSKSLSFYESFECLYPDRILQQISIEYSWLGEQKTKRYKDYKDFAQNTDFKHHTTVYDSNVICLN